MINTYICDNKRCGNHELLMLVSEDETPIKWGRSPYLIHRHKHTTAGGEEYFLCRKCHDAHEQMIPQIVEENIKLRELYEQNHKELLQIHSIACHGWANVLEQPITEEDSMTVRDVKTMAMELLELTK